MATLGLGANTCQVLSLLSLSLFLCLASSVDNKRIDTTRYSRGCTIWLLSVPMKI